MKELSLHILDIVQNSIQAKATKVSISITELTIENSYTIEIRDNGYGMQESEIQQILNPFYTTKNKKTGLGIPLLQQHTQMANGSFEIQSTINEGTIVKATFERNNIDRQPLGDITNTLVSLIRSYPNLDFVYEHKIDENAFVFDTKIIKHELDGISIETPEIVSFIHKMIKENLSELNII